MAAMIWLATVSRRDPEELLRFHYRRVDEAWLCLRDRDGQRASGRRALLSKRPPHAARHAGQERQQRDCEREVQDAEDSLTCHGAENADLAGGSA